MAIFSLFRCLNCDHSADRPPLCASCRGILREAPPLCAVCAGPFCGVSAPCARAWVDRCGIHSFFSGFLAIEPGYTLLRRWKKSRSPLLDRLILPSVFARYPIPRGTEAVLAIPQRASRSWALGGSPAEILARALARFHGLPFFKGLRPGDRRASLRQAELGLAERIVARPRFEINQADLPPPGASVILVDDFMTTGQTLRAAASALRQDAALGEIHVFCLAYRPQLKKLQAWPSAVPEEMDWGSVTSATGALLSKS